MNNILPKENLVLLCDNGYIVKQVLYSDIHFDAQEIEHKSLISVADTESFDAVLHLVNDLRKKGQVNDCKIKLVLGTQTHCFNFSGTSHNDQVLLTAYCNDQPETETGKNHNTKQYFLSEPVNSQPTTEDGLLIEELNQISKNIPQTKRGWIN